MVFFMVPGLGELVLYSKSTLLTFPPAFLYSGLSRRKNART